VKGLAKACTTGHATNIIQGIALGYESTVAAIVVIALQFSSPCLVYAGTSSLHRLWRCHDRYRYVDMTGNTISMDVFGPVADNANGIGEMGYEKAEMEKEKPGSYNAPGRFLPILMPS